MTDVPANLQGEKILLRFDSERRLVLDRKTGEYLTQRLYDREEHQSSYIVWNSEKAPIVEAVFASDQKSVTPGDSSVRLVIMKFIEAWEYRGAGLPHPIPEEHPLVEHVCSFIRVVYQSADGIEFILKFVGRDDRGADVDVR